MTMLRGLWWWLTYKRVLVVCDPMRISRSTMMALGPKLLTMRVHAILLKAEDPGYNAAVQVFDIDWLSRKEMKELREMIAETEGRQRAAREDVIHKAEAKHAGSTATGVVEEKRDSARIAREFASGDSGEAGPAEAYPENG